MPRHDCCSKVIIDPHARRRYHDRHGSGRLTNNRMRGNLFNTLAVGAQSTDLVVQVPIGGLIALCSPLDGENGGGWLVFTFLEKDMEVS